MAEQFIIFSSAALAICKEPFRRIFLMTSSLFEKFEPTPEEILTLLRAFMKIDNRKIRAQIIELVESASSEQLTEKHFHPRPLEP